MDKLNCPDVNAARRLRREQDFRFNLELSANDQFLLIAPGECSSRQLGISRTHINSGNDFLRTIANSHAVEQNAGIADYWLAIMDAEDRILGKINLKQQTTAM